MSLAWAPLAIILLLLPGVFFFIGLASYERLPREIVRSGVISEVAMATAIAIGIHTTVILAMGAGDFHLSTFLLQFADYTTTPQKVIRALADRLLSLVIYLAVCTVLGFIFGLLVAKLIVSGPLRRLAAHRWIYDIIDADRRGGIVTAFVMTSLVEDSQVLMYKGRLHDIFLGEGGKISYIILRNCSRYSMKFKEGDLLTTKQLELFGATQGDRPAHVWDRLIIDGDNIANVLFDSSPEIKGQAEGAKRLDEELKASRERQAALRKRLLDAAREQGRSAQSMRRPV